MIDDDDDEALQAVLLASLEAMNGEEAKLPEQSFKQQEDLFSSVTPPPLVSLPSSLSGFAEGLSEDVRRSLSDLEKPPTLLKLVRVRGDGHCLFRVCGAALVLAAWRGREAIDKLLDHMRDPDLHPSARECQDIVIAVLERTKAEPSAAFSALNDEADGSRGQALVAALRRCSVAYMRAHAERFRLCGDGEADWERYCTEMEDMNLARYGGHPELVALSESLRVRIDIHDTAALGPVASVPTYRLGEHLPSTVPIVRGLRRGLHFNLLLQATPEGDVATPDDDVARAASSDAVAEAANVVNVTNIIEAADVVDVADVAAETATRMRTS